MSSGQNAQDSSGNVDRHLEEPSGDVVLGSDDVQSGDDINLLRPPANADVGNHGICLPLSPTFPMSSSLTSSCCSSMSTHSSASTGIGSTSSTVSSGMGTVMSETVAGLATAIYRELEMLIKDHGETNIRTLMSLIIRSLETLDSTTQEREEREVEVELLKEDREQLLTQWERERQLRKKAEQKFLQLEDTFEEKKTKLEDDIRAGARTFKITEIKLKNTVDHVSRLEEKEIESRSNYSKLHERYTELFKFHCEYMERLKGNPGYTGGCSDNGIMTSSQFSKFKLQAMLSIDGSTGVESNKSGKPPVVVVDSIIGPDDSPNNKLRDRTSVKQNQEQLTMRRSKKTRMENGIDCEAVLEFEEKLADFEQAEMKTFTSSEDDTENYSVGEDGSSVGDSADLAISSSFFGMTKEVDKLICENKELIETKNALNILKDDLIERIDDLNGKLEVCQEEIECLRLVKQKCKTRIGDLEVNLKRSTSLQRTDQDEASSQGGDSGDRRFFTRAEMSRVLIEKNMYKQKFMELEEAVRWQDVLRTAKARLTTPPLTRKRTRVWQLFSTLFNPVVSQPNNNNEDNNTQQSTDNLIRSSTTRPVASQSRPANSQSMTNDSLITDFQRITLNDWIAPKCCPFDLPVYINKIPFPKETIEKIRCIVDRGGCCEEQMWLVGGPSKLSSDGAKSSRLVLIDGNGRDKSNDRRDVVKIKTSIDLDIAVGAACYVPEATMDDCKDAYGSCQFCQREQAIAKTNSVTKPNAIKEDTVWLGTDSGIISVHSACSGKTISTFQATGSIFAICCKGCRVIVGLSSGMINVMHPTKDNLWSGVVKHSLKLNESSLAVRAICFMPSILEANVWVGLRNQVFCIDKQFSLTGGFEVHPHRESQVRYIVALHEIAVIGVRLDSTLRVFSIATNQHLQDVDLDPLERCIVPTSKNRTGLGLVKVTCMAFAPDNQLYVGTSNGSIISIPTKWSAGGSCKQQKKNGGENNYLIYNHALISIRHHKHDVQSLCSLKSGDCRVLCSFGNGYTVIGKSTDAAEFSPEQAKALDVVTSKSLCCIAWKA